jgi:uncharacterized membrane protein (DUF485 family)
VSQPPDSQPPGTPPPDAPPASAAPGTRRATENEAAYDLLYASPEFAHLRRRFRRLVLPLMAGFLAWYFAYVLLATYAHDFMAHEVAGRINVGLLLGLAQFVSTFAIAWFYAHRADRDIDPLSAALHTRYVDLLAAESAKARKAAP